MDLSSCTNCGKSEDGDNVQLKACTACKSVKYCNDICQQFHHMLHKRDCKRIVDKLLFKDPPPREECPICMLPLPLERTRTVLQTCCGKLICQGCAFAQLIKEKGRGLRRDDWNRCPFCREPVEKDISKMNDSLNKLVENDNPHAVKYVGNAYLAGEDGYPKDVEKGVNLLIKAGELGCDSAYTHLALLYNEGELVPMDTKKGMHYNELGAKMGNVYARHILGNIEANFGNPERAFKHFVIAAKAGFELSLHRVRAAFTNGAITNEQYSEALEGRI